LVHDKDWAACGFAEGGLYNAARPGYPPEAMDFFVEVFGLNDASHVLDLGAGTGIFTRQLLARVGRLTAVEPSESMRATFAIETPGVEILDGSDVAIPLGDREVAAVFAAQAFHWFDSPRALREIHRVLVPGGGLGLIWNERDTEVSWIRELNHAMLWDVRQPYDAGVDFGAIVSAGPFRDVRRETYRHAQLLTQGQVLQRVLTTSYITLMGDSEREALIDDVAAVVSQLPDLVEMPYATNVYVAFARDVA
jgi:ubiquinone/menaquinone biosynthesis C-methylase UbiE